MYKNGGSRWKRKRSGKRLSIMKRDRTRDARIERNDYCEYPVSSPGAIVKSQPLMQLRVMPGSMAIHGQGRNGGRGSEPALRI